MSGHSDRLQMLKDLWLLNSGSVMRTCRMRACREREGERESSASSLEIEVWGSGPHCNYSMHGLKTCLNAVLIVVSLSELCNDYRAYKSFVV